MNKQLVLIAFIALVTGSMSCKNNRMVKLKSGLEYQILKKSGSSNKIKVGNILSMHVIARLRDTVLFNTYEMNNKQPVSVTVSEPMFNGDMMEGLPMLAEGDSAIFKVPADSMARGNALPPFIKKGDKIAYTVKIVKVVDATAFQKQKAEKAGKQREIDEQLIAEYIASKHLDMKKTGSGVYYHIEKEGNGTHPKETDIISINYKGRLLDGTEFDASPAGKPMESPLNQLIPGWIEGIPLFSVGGKGTLIIPSSLAYGGASMGKIKANSVLVFDIELVDIIK
ncbi:MAG TPA: FKBP-type peptidyl-prolyl cis-trans isomerase [Chitinophagaceae bacterium]|nr:FKBP-type peptidyl-prolyl cis-trans isomerase [Chitinophagaceae bacterium]